MRAIRACDRLRALRLSAMRVRYDCQVLCSCICRDLALSVPCTASLACLGMSLSHGKKHSDHGSQTDRRRAAAARGETRPPVWKAGFTPSVSEIDLRSPPVTLGQPRPRVSLGQTST